jgi:lysosomal alpha-mannosidase
VSEARQVVATAAVGTLPGPVAWASQVIRLWANATSTELEWTVGPIPFADGLGKEVVSRFTIAGMATNGSWTTDSNGRDMVPRVRNYRKYFNYTDSEPVAGNYYPVNAAIETRDVASGLTLAVVTDRSQGGSSMVDGSVELMVHRRLAHDDNRGVSEPLNETGLDGNGLAVRGTHRLLINPAAGAAAARRAVMQDVALYRPVAVYAGFTGTPAAWLAAGHKATFSGLAAPLPPNAHLVTVHSWGPATTLVRLAHLFGAGEDAALSANVTVSLGGLFSGLKLGGCTETTLTGNQPLADVARTTFRGVDGDAAAAPVEVTLPHVPAPPAGDAMDVTLTPMGIRTFLCSPQ